MTKADEICIPLQKKVLKGRKANSFTLFREPGETVLDEGIVYKNDFCYGEKYPNSFFDIWYPSEAQVWKEGTVVYFHGGGFLFGSKAEGDPLAVGEDSSVGMLKELAVNGWRIVSADYALAPEYRFPEQIRQTDEFLRFLVTHGRKYSLDTDRLILMGSSAGANLVELYGALLTNPSYASVLGIVPSIGKDKIAAIVVDESALDLTDMGEAMELLAGAWLGVEPVSGSCQAKLLNAPAWIREGYPRTFVISSNAERIFHTNAVVLQRAIQKNGGACEIFDGTDCTEPLPHGFLSLMHTSPGAKACFDKLLYFLKGENGWK